MAEDNAAGANADKDKFREALERRQRSIVLDVRADIHSCRALGHVRQQIELIDPGPYPFDLDTKLFHRSRRMDQTRCRSSRQI